MSVVYLSQPLFSRDYLFKALKVQDHHQHSNKETVIDEFTDDVVPTDDDHEDGEETQLPDENIKVLTSGSLYHRSTNLIHTFID